MQPFKRKWNRFHQVVHSVQGSNDSGTVFIQLLTILCKLAQSYYTKWKAQLSTCCSSWNFINCCIIVRKITFWKVTVIIIATVWQAIYHFRLVIFSNNVSILHHFRDITTFTVYVTAYDLGNSLSFNKTVEITDQFTCKHIVVNMCYICRGMGVQKVSDAEVIFRVTVFKVIAISAIWLAMCDFLLCLYCTVCKILSVISQKLMRSREP